ncbi:MAG: hydantoinase/oxoprolinase family protein, partial [Pseudomonadota bacterium]
DLVLGKLDADNFAGGAIPLDPGAADAALRTHVGGPLSMDATEAAFGLAEVVDENMANAARVHAVENGEDLGSYTMVAFGGAAPLHAARLCEKLGVARLIVPPGAGVGSAIGFLRAPFSFEATRSVYMKLAQFDPDRIRTLLGDLRAEAEGFVRSCDGAAAISCDYKVYMRYSGQGWEIPVPLSLAEATDPRAAAFAARFDAAYSRLFGRTVAGMDVEITVWAVNASTPSATPEPSVEAPNAGPAPIAGTRPLFDAVAGRFTSAQIVARDGMQPGHTTAGPAAITEAETTTIVPEGRRATCQSDGCLDIRTAGDTP